MKDPLIRLSAVTALFDDVITALHENPNLSEKQERNLTEVFKALRDELPGLVNETPR